MQKKSINYQDVNFLVRLYSRDLADHAVLSRSEEKSLFLMRKYGTPQEREAATKKLIVSNLKYVFEVAQSLWSLGSPVSLIDMINEGNLGLMKAIERFDEQRELKLITYARFWIRAYIRAILEDEHPLQGTKNTYQRRAKLIKVAEKEFMQSEQRLPKSQELAVITGLSTKQIKNFRVKSSLSLTSLEKPIASTVNDSGVPKNTLDIFPDERYAGYEKRLIKEMIMFRLNEFVKSLGRVEKDIFLARHGILGMPKRTLLELAKKYSSNKEQIRKIEKIIKKKFKLYLEKYAYIRDLIIEN